MEKETPYGDLPAKGSALKGAPEHDLVFGSGIGSYGTQEAVLGWALGTNIPALNSCPMVAAPDYSCPTPAGAPMSFADVKSLIDSGKPFGLASCARANANASR